MNDGSGISRSGWRAVLSAVLGLIAIAQAVAAAPGDTPIVRVLPPTAEVRAGQLLTVEVQIEQVVNLYGADVQLTFATERLQVQDADSLKPGIQIIPRGDLLSPDFVVLNQASNLSGTVRYAVTQINPTPPVTGTGVLLAVVLTAGSPGPATIGFADVLLSTPDGIPIAAVTSGATFTITPPVEWGLFLPFISRSN